MKRIEIRPQSGPQEEFLASEADIAIYGGAAGGGKTFSLLLDCTRHVSNGEAGAVIFRRTFPQITNEGGLWDEALKLYLPQKGKPREGQHLDITFPSGFTVSFRQLQHEKTVYDYMGAQIPVIGFDELTHFSKKQFFYMLSRNRSVCGIKPYIRATCNPDKTSWVRELIDWWIGEDGYPIKERSGVLRWLIHYDEKYFWFNSKEEALERFPDNMPLSVTFIPAKLEDNKILIQKDPAYKSKLMALSKIERERLLDGNWNVIPIAGTYFKRHYFEEIDFLPRFKKIVRWWDRAATEWKEGEPNEPDGTAGAKIGQTYDDQYVIIDLEYCHFSAGKVEKVIVNTARQDGINTTIGLFQDPGAAGKGEAESMVKTLSGFSISVNKINVDKETAARPMSAQAEFGNIKVYSKCRNKEKLYSQLEDFPLGSHDDIVDGCTGAFNYLNSDNTGNFTDDFIDKSIDNDFNKEDY